MLNIPNDALDADELFQLAVAAIQNQQQEQSLSLLKRAVSLEPKHSKAVYLLGALHAQLGLYERAIEEISHALEQDPELQVARFQLGLLYLLSNQKDNAKKTWLKLAQLGQQHYFYWFQLGLLKIAEEDIQNGIDYLEKGMTLNQQNLALNKDMSQAIQSAKSKMDQNSPSQKALNAVKPSNEAVISPNLFLSAYFKNDDDTEH